LKLLSVKLFGLEASSNSLKVPEVTLEMDVLSALTPQEILERDKIPRVWKPAYVWPAENDGLVRVVEGYDFAPRTMQRQC
jgi:hypothetical protein